MYQRFKHPIERALERYELALTWENIADLERALEYGEGKWIGWDGQGRQVYTLNVKKTACLIVYNPESRHLVTFLPTDWEPHEKALDVRDNSGFQKSWLKGQKRVRKK